AMQPQDQDPALQGFNRPAEYIKHTVKSGFRGALKGALIGVGAALVIGLAAATFLGFLLAPLGVAAAGLFGASSALAGAIGTVTGATVGTTAGVGAMAALTSAAGTIALFGAKVGGVIGLATGALGAEDAVSQNE